ncbi:MAG: UDP-N-acetylmuramate--L-alanine ligase [Bacteroidetes bacterium]|nr:UDP-N-acetylmuramate--L-alanine ligase [Bacteroidota bacterium]
MNNEINKSLDEIGVVYFIGIGGIGMSALARFFKSRDMKVSGYDKTPSVLTRELETEGINIHYEENLDLIPKEVDLIVYTPAIPEEHQELKYYRSNGYQVYKRSDVLKLLTKSSFNICIAGTHGKTTITTMIAHLLRDSGYGCTAFLGGISANYGTNFWSSNNAVCVVEADEYDRSFLKLNPDIAIITAMDADHLDIYGTPEAMEQAFIEFSNKLKQGGLLINRFGLKRGSELKAERHITYSLQNVEANAYATNIKLKQGGYEFDVIIGNKKIEQVRLNMGGMHNVENVIAAISVASSLDIDSNKIKAAVESFKGVKRRFEYIIKNDQIVFVDDYAHHPEELRALIQGAKSLFEGKKCTIIFQPHLYSRTRDLAEGFAEVLSYADQVILLPIYPARELPISGVSSEMIIDKMSLSQCKVLNKEELMEWIKNQYMPSVNRDLGEIIITAGAGNIDMLVSPIKEILKEL